MPKYVKPVARPLTWEYVEEFTHSDVRLALIRYPTRIELMHFEVAIEGPSGTWGIYFAKDEEAQARACFADEKAKLGAQQILGY